MDTHYRYKMPVITLSTKKNQTSIDNLSLLSKTLNKEPMELLKMWSYALGTNLTPKTSSLGGFHTFSQLHDALIKYIDEFIICQKCGNPETTYTIYKSRFCLECRACCGLSKIKSDTKLTKYLITQTKAREAKQTSTAIENESLLAQFELPKFN